MFRLHTRDATIEPPIQAPYDFSTETAGVWMRSLLPYFAEIEND